MMNDTRTFGIELEVYNPRTILLMELIPEIINNLQAVNIPCVDNFERYNHNDSNVNWKIVRDYSIHGRNGFEIVSPILKGTNGFDQIKKVCKVLNNVGCKVNKSCGLHVHHQAEDISKATIKKFFDSYKNNESLIDSIMPYSRRNDINGMIDSLKYIDFGEWSEIINDDGDGSNRYYKINYQSIVRHGTIEFRHHSGTLNPTKIINWIELTQVLLLKSTGFKFNSLDELLSSYDVSSKEYFLNRALSLA